MAAVLTSGMTRAKAVVGAGADGGVEPGRGVAVVDHALRADAALEPGPDAAALLANTGFVLAPKLHLCVGMASGDFA
jgi:hypothetical protein